MRRSTRWLALLALCACDPQPPPASRVEPARQAPVAERPRAVPARAPLVYLEEIVGDAAPDATLPMLVLIHGRGDRPARGWLPLQLPVPVRVIMPQAPLPFGDGFSWSTARASEAEGPSGEALARDLERQADAIAATVEQLRRERPTSGRPLVAGFSQGGMLSYALAVRHPAAFQLAIPIAGLLPRALWPSEKPKAALPKLRALHGTADSVVPIVPARDTIDQLRSVGYDARLIAEEDVAHSISPTMLQTLNTLLGEALNPLTADDSRH